MTRFLYRLLLRLHPTRFRERFGNEMLAVFDDARTSRSGVSLVLSLVWSLIRQRLLRPAPPHVLSGMALSEPLQRAWDLRRGIQRVDRLVILTWWLYALALMFVMHLVGFRIIYNFPRTFLAMGLVAALLDAYGYWKRQVRTADEYRADLRADELDGEAGCHQTPTPSHWHWRYCDRHKQYLAFRRPRLGHGRPRQHDVRRGIVSSNARFVYTHFQIEQAYHSTDSAGGRPPRRRPRSSRIGKGISSLPQSVSPTVCLTLLSSEWVRTHFLRCLLDVSG